MFPPKLLPNLNEAEALASRHGRDSESLGTVWPGRDFSIMSTWLTGRFTVFHDVMLGRHVKRYHSSQSAYKNPQISASLWKTWPQVCLTLTSLSNPDGHTNFWGMVRWRSDTPPCRSHQRFWWFCQEEFSSLFDPVFLGVTCFYRPTKWPRTTGEGEGEFQRECRICWILSKMNWLVLLQPTNFVNFPRFLRFSKALWIVWQVQIPNKLGAQPDSVAIQRFQAHFLCLL